jgi:hypothetical protein
MACLPVEHSNGLIELDIGRWADQVCLLPSFSVDFKRRDESKFGNKKEEWRNWESPMSNLEIGFGSLNNVLICLTYCVSLHRLSRKTEGTGPMTS